MEIFGRGHGFLGLPKRWNIRVIWLVAVTLIIFFLAKQQWILALVVFGLATIFTFMEMAR